MQSPWPVPIGRLMAGATVYAMVVALMSWTFTMITGLSRWTMTPAGPARSYVNLLLVNLATWCGWAALAVVVFWLGRRVRFGTSTWVRALLVHGAASIGVAASHGVLVASVRYWGQTRWGLTPDWLATVVENFFRTIDTHVPIYWALLGLQHAVDSHRETRARDVAAAQLETRLVEAQLQALHRQVHPHFLFNTLHAISALLHHAPDRAEAMIERLSDMLRVTLSTGGVQLVPLRQELDFLRAYLDIEQVHFGPRLRVEQAIDARTLDILVPNLVLQPLAENALRHGLAPQPDGGTLHIGASLDGDILVLVMRDDGRGPQPRPATHGHGVGLANTRARLEALYREAAVFEVNGRSGGGTEVTLRLPIAEAAVAHPQARRAS